MNNENYKVVLDFLSTTNMSSDPDKWKDEYKVFKKETIYFERNIDRIEK